MISNYIREDYNMFKKIISGAVAGTLMVSSASVLAMSTNEFDNGIQKGIEYYNKGLYGEARDEFQWFCDANWSKLNDGQKKYALDYLGESKRNYYINAILGWWINYENMCSTQYYFKPDGTMEVYFDSRPVHWDGYYTVNDNRIDYTYTVVERTNTIISGHIEYQDGQLKDYNEEGEYSGNLIKTQNYMTADDIATKFVYNNENVAFDDIKDELSEIVECFHNGLYIETVDKCNYILDNYILNNDDRKDVLFYRDSAQACYDAYVKTDNNSRNGLSTNEFDNGMRKGIDYFNKGMYYEARDEFQWFCDYNWGKMNASQQQYALDYLGATNQKVQQWENQSYSNYLGEWCQDSEYCEQVLIIYELGDGKMLYWEGNGTPLVKYQIDFDGREARSYDTRYIFENGHIYSYYSGVYGECFIDYIRLDEWNRKYL